MKDKKSFKKIFILFSLISIALLVIFYLLYKDIKNKNENISSLSQEMEFQSDRREYFVSTQRMLDGIRDDLNRVNSLIVSKDSDVAFIEGLEAVAKNNGLSINIESIVIEDDSALSSNEITTLKIKAKTEGSWSGTYAFLAELESFSYRVRVNKFSFTSDTGKDPSSDGVREWQSLFEIRVLKYK